MPGGYESITRPVLAARRPAPLGLIHSLQGRSMAVQKRLTARVVPDALHRTRLLRLRFLGAINRPIPLHWLVRVPLPLASAIRPGKS